MVAQKMTLIPRRQAMRLLTGIAASSVFSLKSFATPDKVASRISEITNGKKVSDIDIYLDMPEIAENGNQVKIVFEIDSPMSEAEYVKTVYVLAEMNNGLFAKADTKVKVTIGGCGG